MGRSSRNLQLPRNIWHRVLQPCIRRTSSPTQETEEGKGPGGQRDFPLANIHQRADLRYLRHPALHVPARIWGEEATPGESMVPGREVAVELEEEG